MQSLWTIYYITFVSAKETIMIDLLQEIMDILILLVPQHAHTLIDLNELSTNFK